ncbi:hypothetical protein TrVE_jg11206 [Triparma verrucosa]|uniref:Uncharacterized protein n=1 Tax=Triparma verrucosa TaxID=1606542 RepID=A0A9W7CG66_9STRA|nr:hypothetical protein TrVE_jg11206 [Triparma verrucosa]
MDQPSDPLKVEVPAVTEVTKVPVATKISRMITRSKPIAKKAKPIAKKAKPAAKKKLAKAPRKKAATKTPATPIHLKKPAAKRPLATLSFVPANSSVPFPGASGVLAFEEVMSFLAHASGTFLTHSGEFTTTRYMSGIKEVVAFDIKDSDISGYYDADRPGDPSDAYRPARSVTTHDLNEIAYPFRVLQLRSNLEHIESMSDGGGTHGMHFATRAISTDDPEGFTLHDVLRAVGMYEKFTRNGTKWMDGVDGWHLGFDGMKLDVEEKNVWRILWVACG